MRNFCQELRKNTAVKEIEKSNHVNGFRLLTMLWLKGWALLGTHCLPFGNQCVFVMHARTLTAEVQESWFPKNWHQLVDWHQQVNLQVLLSRGASLCKFHFAAFKFSNWIFILLYTCWKICFCPLYYRFIYLKQV